MDNLSFIVEYLPLAVGAAAILALVVSTVTILTGREERVAPWFPTIPLERKGFAHEIVSMQSEVRLRYRLWVEKMERDDALDALIAENRMRWEAKLYDPWSPKEPQKPPTGARLHSSLDTLGFFIPRTIREPWWDHMLEDRDEMVKKGRSATVVRLAICSQFALLLLVAGKDTLLQILLPTPKSPKG